jgi:hypothetical protein
MLSSPLLKEEKIEWLFFLFFTLDIGLFFKKRGISLGKRKLG